MHMFMYDKIDFNARRLYKVFNKNKIKACLQRCAK